MEYKFDSEPSEKDINEVRGGLIEHNTPFLEGIPKSQVGLLCFGGSKESRRYYRRPLGKLASY